MHINRVHARHILTVWPPDNMQLGKCKWQCKAHHEPRRLLRLNRSAHANYCSKHAPPLYM